jgi:protein O-mannosyl-transferase
VSEANPGEVRRASPVACVLLALAVIALFGRVVGFPFLAFDDAELILRNPQVTAPLRAPIDLLFTPHVGYVVPVTVALQAALHTLGGGEAWPFHLASLLLHALYACQLYLLLNRLGAETPAAFAGALLFAVHPLVVQPVAWAICLKDLLMANLVLLAIRMLWRSQAAPDELGTHRSETAVIAGALAMLAKPTATLLGVAWLPVAASLRKRNPDAATFVLRPALVLVAIGGVVGLASRFLHQSSFGSAESRWTLSTPFEVLGRQLAHVFWPVDLLVMYPSPAEAPSPVLLALGIAALLLVTALAAFVRRPETVLLFALAVAIYLPTSNLLPFGRVISDSYMYVPLSMLACWAALRAQRALRERPAVGPWLGAAALALALALAIGTHRQLPRYRGGDALWGPVVRAHPSLASGHIYFADELVFRAQPGRAAAAYQRGFALGYDPGHLLEFGTTLALANRLPDAECVLIEAVAYGSEPGYARFNLAALLAMHSEYRPRHPLVVAAMLGELDAQRRAGRLAWPKPLEAGLTQQLARLRGLTGDVAWPQRNCPLLRAAR